MPHLLARVKRWRWWLHHTAHQGFVGAKAVERSGVEQGHARIQRGQQHAFALLGRHRRAIGVRKVHAAQVLRVYTVPATPPPAMDNQVHDAISGRDPKWTTPGNTTNKKRNQTHNVESE